jgi:hypothetical protein
MYCPKCHTEYRLDFTECSDCRVALTPGRPPTVAPEPSIFASDEVALIESQNPVTIINAKAILDAAGIGYGVSSEEVDGGFGRIKGGYMSKTPTTIRILRKDADAAVAALREAGIGEND